MTEQAFDALLREALLEAVMEDLGPVWNGELPEDPQSPRQKRRMLRLLRDPFGGARRRARPIWRRGLRAAVCAVLISAALFAATIAAVPQARAWVKELWSQWFETNTRYEFTGDYNTPTGIWRPSYISAGYVETFSEDNELEGDVIFSNSTGDEISFSYMLLRDSFSFSVDNEHSIYRQIYLSNGTVAEQYTSDTPGWPNFLLWITPDGTTSFLLESCVTPEELTKMAESVTILTD